MLTIRHTHAEGTLLEGSRKGDGVWEIVKQHGFAYFPSIRAIGIRGSRDKPAQRNRIEQAAAALRAAGHEVTVEIDDTPRDRAEVLADQAERLEDRRERLATSADRHQAIADAAYERASTLAERFAGGQPILAGHHSERGARAAQRRIEQAMSKATKEQQIADYQRRRAGRVGKAAEHSANPRTTQRRIERTEADLRDIERRLNGFTRRHLDRAGNPYYIEHHDPAEGEYREQLLARKALLEEQLRYDREQLEKAKAAGFMVWSKENVHPGDKVWYWGASPAKVVRVNPKTVSLETQYSWTDKVKYADIRRVDCPHRDEGPAPEPVEIPPTPAPVAAPVVPAPRRDPEQVARIEQAIAAPAVSAVAYFPTPSLIAAMAVDKAGIADLPDGATVLEPSAGDGQLVRAIRDAQPGVHVVAVEPCCALAERIGQDERGRLTVFVTDLEDFARPDRPKFAAAVMNPPFSAPGRPVLWAEHVAAVYGLLEPGGRLAAIVPASLEFSQDRRVMAVRELCEQYGGMERLPEDAFRLAGTSVRTCLMWLRWPSVVDEHRCEAHSARVNGSTVALLCERGHVAYTMPARDWPGSLAEATVGSRRLDRRSTGVTSYQSPTPDRIRPRATGSGGFFERAWLQEDLFDTTQVEPVR